MKKSALVSSLVLALVGSSGVYADVSNALFILDGSGSMWSKVGDKPKIDIAKIVMTDMLNKLAPELNTGLMVYGHHRKDDCNDIEMVAPMGSDRAAIVQALNAISPKGKTPISGAIQLAAVQLRQYEGNTSIIVVSDGKETCEGDPCMAAREATRTGVNLRIHVVGFDVAPDETQQLNCIAKEGKGKYFAAANAEQLVVALAEVQKEVAATSPPIPTVKVVQAPTPAAPEVLFEDRFDRNDLGEMWEVVNPDPNRLALSDGKLLLVGTNERKNVAVLQRPLSGNFVATVKMDTLTLEKNFGGLYYWIDDKNFLALNLLGGDYGRLPTFDKALNGELNNFKLDNYYSSSAVGGRKIHGYVSKPETWYLQIERSGVKYTGRISTDGTNWTDIGVHSFLAKDGKLALSAKSGGGAENTIEFDDFVVKGAK